MDVCSTEKVGNLSPSRPGPRQTDDQAMSNSSPPELHPSMPPKRGAAAGVASATEKLRRTTQAPVRAPMQLGDTQPDAQGAPGCAPDPDDALPAPRQPPAEPQRAASPPDTALVHAVTQAVLQALAAQAPAPQHPEVPLAEVVNNAAQSMTGCSPVSVSTTPTLPLYGLMKRKRWLILMICYVLAFTSLGLAFGMGAIFNDVMDNSGASRASAATVQSLCCGLCFAAEMVIEPFFRRSSARTTVIAGSVLAALGSVIVFITDHIAAVIVGMGLLTGIGVSCHYLTSAALVSQLSSGESRHSCFTLVSAFAATGAALYPLGLGYLARTYTLSGTYLIVGAVNLQMAVCGALLGVIGLNRVLTHQQNTRETRQETKNRPRNDETELSTPHRVFSIESSSSPSSQPGDRNSEDSYCSVSQPHYTSLDWTRDDGDEENYTSLQVAPTSEQKHGPCATLVSSSSFVNAFLTLLFTSPLLSFMIPLFFMTDIVLGKMTDDREFPTPAFSPEYGSFLLSMLFVGTVLGNLAAGVLRRIVMSKICLTFCVSALIAGATCFCYTLAESTTQYVLVSIAYGVSFAIYLACLPLALPELIGPERCSEGTAFLSAVAGVCILISGPLGGVIRDATGSYQVLFYAAAAQGAVCCLLALIVTYIRCCRRE